VGRLRHRRTLPYFSTNLPFLGTLLVTTASCFHGSTSVPVADPATNTAHLCAGFWRRKVEPAGV
jgi:hypothetical protein